jgi:hypothetical protein
MAKKKTPKPTITRAHKLARKIAKSSGRTIRNPYAVGMAAAKKQAAARKRKRQRAKAR